MNHIQAEALQGGTLVDEPIVLVDDEEKLGELLADLVTKAGYSVLRFTQPTRVLDYVRDKKPLLLLTDLKMPEMSGLELATRARQAIPDLPVVILTGYASIETAVRALRSGIDDYLTKPFSYEELVKVLERVLRARRLEKENRRLVEQLQRANQELLGHKRRLTSEVESANIELREANLRLTRIVEDLGLLHHVAQLSTTTREKRQLLEEALGSVCSRLRAEIGSVLVAEANELIAFAVFGDRSRELLNLRRPITGGIAGTVFETGRPLFSGYEANPAANRLLARRPRYQSGQFVSTPITARGRVIGVLSVADREGGLPFTREDAGLLETAAGEIGIAFDNLQQEEARRDDWIQTIHTLVETFEAKAPGFRGHSGRVARLVQRYAEHEGLSEEDRRRLVHAAYLHDVGKVAIPEEILSKNGKLTDDEYRVVQQHPVLGVQILRHLEFLADVRPIVRAHHERWDGCGYPDALKGHDIPRLATILAVADTWDAMLNERPYRPPLSREEALNELRTASGRQFDPKVVEAFISILQPSGTPALRYN